MRQFKWALVAALLISNPLFAADKQEEAKPATEAKRAEAAPAADIAKELGLSLPSVNSLGLQIQAARDSFDPIALATAARELGALEKATGKKASVTSAELATEAATMAARRYIAAELKTVALLIPDEGAAEKLKTLADKAEKEEQAAKTAKAAGGSFAHARGIQRSLHVDNRTPWTVAIFLDGRYVGAVNAYGDGIMWVGQGPYETTILDGVANSVGRWHSEITIPVGDYTWTVLP